MAANLVDIKRIIGLHKWEGVPAPRAIESILAMVSEGFTGDPEVADTIQVIVTQVASTGVITPETAIAWIEQIVDNRLGA